MNRSPHDNVGSYEFTIVDSTRGGWGPFKELRKHPHPNFNLGLIRRNLALPHSFQSKPPWWQPTQPDVSSGWEVRFAAHLPG